MFRDLILSRLGGLLPPDEIRRWFEPLQWDCDEDSGHLRITAPTIFHHRRLTEKYAAHLTELASEIAGRKVERLTLESKGQPSAAAPLPALEALPDPPGLGSVDPGHTFQSFVAADSNRLVLLALNDFIAGEPKLGARSIFLVSPGPWGKTHLLDALTIKLSEEPGRRFLRISASGGFQAPPRDARRRGWVLIVDDIHLLEGKTEEQQNLAQFFDEMASGASGLICSAPVPPQKLAGFSESLRSRLSGGLVLKIEPPEYDLLMTLAARQTGECGLTLAPETLSLLVRRCESDPRRLRGFIETVCFAAERGGLDPDAAARRFLPEPGPGAPEKRVDLDGILAAVSAAFGLKVADLTGHSKLRQTAWPRRVAMYLAKEMTGLTTSKIGEALGGRDHSTVIHALKKIGQELKNPAQARLVENIRRSLLVG